jgi:succinate dehydrogenase hydrophobic anchor subunit
MDERELQRRRREIASGKNLTKWGFGIGLAIFVPWIVVKILAHHFGAVNTLIKQHETPFWGILCLALAFIVTGITGVGRAVADENDDDAWKGYEELL